MKNKTLVIIHPHLTLPGGAGKVILELGKRISRTIKVVIVAQKINSEYIENYPEIKFESLNGPVTSSLKFWLLLPYWRKKTFQVIEKYRQKENITILCNVFPANWVGLPYKKKHPEIKILWFCHEPSAFIHIKKWRNSIQSPLKRFIANTLAPILSSYDKSLVKFADIIFSNSKFTSSNIKRIYNRDSVVIYPGVDINILQPIDYKSKENYILTVGRLTKFKNIDMLIKAVAKIKNRTIKLKIVGDGEEKENMRQLIKELKVSDRIEILSGLSDEQVATLYTKAKIFILCSKEEPFGMVPVEALASGTMVIADNSGGPKEIISNNVNGILIDNITPSKITAAIDDLFSNKEKIKKLSSYTKEKVADVFTWDKSAEKMLQNI